MAPKVEVSISQKSCDIFQHHHVWKTFHMSHSFPAVRYDHLSVLCELMPVALPSLAACLQTLSHGHFSAEAQSEVTKRLGIPSVEVEAIER